MRRHEARQCALQALFQVDVGKAESEEAILHVLEAVDKPVAESDRLYVERLVRGTQGEMGEIDSLIRARVVGWDIDRIARVDLNVLRLAIYELLRELDVDVATIVDEAVELAKHFGSDDSGKFVNGALSRVLPMVRQSE